MSLVTVVRNIIGRFRGFGGCLRCETTWDQVRGFTIPYSIHRGMFPLCELCFARCSTEDIDMYIDRLVDLWELSSPTDDHNGMPYADVRAQAKAAARYLKGELPAPPFASPDWHASH